MQERAVENQDGGAKCLNASLDCTRQYRRKSSSSRRSRRRSRREEGEQEEGEDEEENVPLQVQERTPNPTWNREPTKRS